MTTASQPSNPRRRTRRRSAERRAAARLLVVCARRDGGFDDAVAQRLLEEADASTIVELARFHRIGGLAYDRLSILPTVSPVILGPLEAQFLGNVAHHQQALRELVRLQPVLDGIGVPWAVVRGPAAVKLLYRSAGLRPYRDLDILVGTSGFADALTALEGAGAQVLDRNWKKLRREMRGEVQLALPSGDVLDLHWDLIATNRGGKRGETDAVLGRAVRIDLGGFRVPTLDDADRAIHLAVHAALNGGDRLGWLKDLERIATVTPPDWDVLVDRARQWNVARAAGLLLFRAEQVLGADIPANTIRQLLGSRTTRMVRVIDRRWPPEGASDGPTPTRIVARLIGIGLARATAISIHRVLRRLLSWSGIPAESSPNAADADRAAFVRAVSTWRDSAR